MRWGLVHYLPLRFREYLLSQLLLYRIMPEVGARCHQLGTLSCNI